jgi:hypothetical protein
VVTQRQETKAVRPGANAYDLAKIVGYGPIFELFCRAKVLKARHQLCSATKLVSIEGYPLAADEVVRRPGRNRAVRVTRDGATAGVAYASHRHAVNLEMSGTAADHLTAVRRGIT